MEEDGAHNYLVFRSIVRYFTVITPTVDYIASGKSTGLSAETNKPPTMSNNSLTPTLNYYDDLKARVKFTRSCLK